MLPETANVTAGRPELYTTSMRNFEFRHIRPNLLRDYQAISLGDQQALVATPEKELLGLVYLQADREKPECLRELRLQNAERLG